MKKVLALVAATGILAVASLASAASIANSKHDMYKNYPGGDPQRQTQICVYCHAPHNAKESLPLWNRTNPAGSAFTLYSGLNMANVSFKTGFTSDSTSLFCMSCHDGQTNVNAVHNAGAIAGTNTLNAAGGRTGGNFVDTLVSGPANLTRDLSKTHPVNFPVSGNSQNDLIIVPGASVMGPVSNGASGIIGAVTFPLFKSAAAGIRGSNNQMLECGSCHAVHDSGYSPFLRDTMGRSQLCLGCHNK